MKSALFRGHDAAGEGPTLLTSSEVAEQVGREILESRLDPAAWASALAEAGGRRSEAIAAYTRIRARRLGELHRVQRSRDLSLDSRRVVKCMGDPEARNRLARSIQELLDCETRDGPLNYVKPRLSALWLLILFLGSAGTIASFGRLFATKLPDIGPVAVIAPLAGLLTVVMAVVLRYRLPKRWVMLGWNTGLVAACNVLCLCSLMLGAKVIKRAVSIDARPVPAREALATPNPAAGTPAKTYLTAARAKSSPL